LAWSVKKKKGGKKLSGFSDERWRDGRVKRQRTGGEPTTKKRPRSDVVPDIEPLHEGKASGMKLFHPWAGNEQEGTEI